MGRLIGGVCDSVCLCVCPRTKENDLSYQINAKLGIDTAHGSRSACTNSEVKRSKIKCAVGVGVRVDRTTWVFELLLYLSHVARRCLW